MLRVPKRSLLHLMHSAEFENDAYFLLNRDRAADFLPAGFLPHGVPPARLLPARIVRPGTVLVNTSVTCGIRVYSKSVLFLNIRYFASSGV